MDFHNSKERDLFWEAYRGCAEENRVRPDRSPFYVKWAKDFAHFLPEKPLKDRSRKDIEAFLADLGKRQAIADWQVRQAEHALKILYEIFLPRYAPERHSAVESTGEPPPQETIARKKGFWDRVIPGEVERQFPELIEAVKTGKVTCHTLRHSLRQASFDRLRTDSLQPIFSKRVMTSIRYRNCWDMPMSSPP